MKEAGSRIRQNPKDKIQNLNAESLQKTQITQKKRRGTTEDTKQGKANPRSKRQNPKSKCREPAEVTDCTEENEGNHEHEEKREGKSKKVKGKSTRHPATPKLFRIQANHSISMLAVSHQRSAFSWYKV